MALEVHSEQDVVEVGIVSAYEEGLRRAHVQGYELGPDSEVDPKQPFRLWGDGRLPHLEFQALQGVVTLLHGSDDDTLIWRGTTRTELSQLNIPANVEFTHPEVPQHIFCAVVLDHPEAGRVVSPATLVGDSDSRSRRQIRRDLELTTDEEVAAAGTLLTQMGTVLRDGEIISNGIPKSTNRPTPLFRGVDFGQEV